MWEYSPLPNLEKRMKECLASIMPKVMKSLCFEDFHHWEEAFYMVGMISKGLMWKIQPTPSTQSIILRLRTFQPPLENINCQRKRITSLAFLPKQILFDIKGKQPLKYEWTTENQQRHQVIAKRVSIPFASNVQVTEQIKWKGRIKHLTFTSHWWYRYETGEQFPAWKHSSRS